MHYLLISCITIYKKKEVKVVLYKILLFKDIFNDSGVPFPLNIFIFK